MPQKGKPDYRHVTFGSGGRIEPRSERIGEDLKEIDAHLARNRQKLAEAKRKLEEFKARHHGGQQGRHQSPNRER